MATNGWNFADIWEVVAEALPDAQAQVQGKRRYSWAEFDQRANGIASALLGLGVERQDKVAHYLYNCPEYLESMFGMYKTGLVPVNTNYRYADDELLYLWDNADAVAVVFHGTFTERIEGLRSKLPKVKGWLWVDDGSGPRPDWAIDYEEAAAANPGRVEAPWGRSGDDLYMLYTGGTTGMPKGVMWRQEDLFLNLNASAARRYAVEEGLAGIKPMLTAPGMVQLPACPLMHGTGAFTSMSALTAGGSVVTLSGRTFDVEELLDTIQAERVNTMAIVGDAFAKPMLNALDANPGRWDISSLVLIASSGVMWSEATKQGLLRHHPSMILADAFSSSEALGMGTSVSTGGQATRTAKFSLGENARVITEDGRDVEPGSGEVGMVAVKGRGVPIGYYKDPEKSARTFKVIDGERYSIPGDFATVEADGSLKLLGRGSVCINTGGEKVFPEEVEEALKEHPAVADAVAVGVPDDRFGEAICALVQARPGATVEEADVIAHVKSRLAGYKAPRRVFAIDTVGRAPNGKVDYKRLRELAISRVGG
ncbi:MAG TPA: acyl-CoA synthetase [Acidimicrobiales bacterium]|nr:acyl-CoA synthetase [Acidimicrobiales bacterium]